MFQTTSNTTVISSTDLKREYKKVQDLLNKNMILVITNRNSDDKVDGIMIPYSPFLIEHLEEMLEEMEIEQNRKKLDKEFAKSLQSGKKKRIRLNDVKL